MENPFKLSNENNNSNNNNLYNKRKSRIVLDEIKANSKKSKKYAMEFENLYDNIERDINFEEKIEINRINSLELESVLKENNDTNNNCTFRKKSSLIIPFGSAYKIKKEEDIFGFNLYDNDNNNINNGNNNFNNFNNCNDNDEYFCQNLLKRKSSILGILESNVNRNRNSNATGSASNSNLIPDPIFTSVSSFVENK
jgi:hypothetical protein